MKQQQWMGWGVGVLFVLAASCGDGAPARSGGEEAAAEPAAEAVAEVPLAEVSLVVGSGQAQVCGASCEQASLGSVLGAGAGLVTDAEARVQLKGRDGSMVWVDAGTRVRMLESGGLQLEAGRALVETGGELRVESPAGVLVLRQGSASVRAEEDAAGEVRTRISVLTGTAQLTAGSDLKPLAAGESALAEGRGEVRILPSADLAYQTTWAREMRVEAEADESGVVPRGIGNIFGRHPATKQELPDAITVERLSVHVTARERVARTEIEQVFANTTKQTLEGVYTFPLPPDASIVRFAMEVGGQLMEGEILEKQRAVRIFDRIVADHIRPRDPALLEWKGGNTFQMRIFPMFAGQTSRVVLWYTQALPADGTETRYTYPLPRAGSQEIASFQFSADVSSEQALRTVRTPMYASSVDLAQGSPRATVRFEKERFHPRQDLVLEWDVAQYAPAGTWTGAGPDAAESPYFMMVLRPSLTGAPAAPESGRDYAFLLDTSYGTAEGDLKASVAAVAAFLSELRPDDRFTVLAGGQRFAWFQRGMQPWTAEQVQQAIGFMEQQRPEGASWLEGLFAEGARALSGDRPGALVYIGDGRATLGETRPEALVDAVEARLVGPHRPVIHTIGIGSEVNAPLLNLLTRRTGGASLVVNRGEDVPKRVRGLATAGRRPALRQALLNFSTDQIEWVYPTQLPTLRQGEELVLVGRFKGEVDAQVTLTGLVGDQPFAQPFRVQLSATQAGRESFVPRIWAQRHIEHLTLYGDASAREDIVSTSLKHTVLSRYTAFLVLESERMYREFQVSRNTNRDYWDGKLAKNQDTKDEPKEVAKKDTVGSGEAASAAPMAAAEAPMEEAEAPGAEATPPMDEAAPVEIAAPRDRGDEDNEDVDMPRVFDDLAAGADTGSAGEGFAQPDPAQPVSKPAASTRREDTLAREPSGDANVLQGTLGAGKGGGGLRDQSFSGQKDAKAKKEEAPQRRAARMPSKPASDKSTGGRVRTDSLGPRGNSGMFDIEGGRTRYPQYTPRPFASIQSLSPQPAEAGAAFGELDRQIAAEPLRRELHRRLIKAQLERGDAAAALAAAERWVKLDPQNAEVHWRLGELLAYGGRDAEAALEFGASVELSSQDAKVLDRWGRSLALREDFTLASAVYSALTALTGRVDDLLERVLVESRVDRKAAREHLAHLRAMHERELSAAQRREADALSALLDAATPPGGPLVEAFTANDLRGAAAVTLSWDAAVDLDLALLLPNGERVSPAMPRSVLGDGKRGRVVGEHAGGAGAREGIALEWAPPGRYLIEVARHDGSTEAVEAQVTLRALGQQRSFRVAIPAGDRDVRVAQITVELR